MRVGYSQYKWPEPPHFIQSYPALSDDQSSIYTFAERRRGRRSASRSDTSAGVPNTSGATSGLDGETLRRVRHVFKADVIRRRSREVTGNPLDVLKKN